MDPLAAFQFALQILPIVKVGTNAFIGWMKELKAELQRTGRWTDEMDAQFEAAVLASAASAAAQPDGSRVS